MKNWPWYGYVVFAALIFALAFRRFRTYFEEDVEEERESVLSLDLLKAQLAELFRRKVRTPAPPPYAVTVIDDTPAGQVNVPAPGAVMVCVPGPTILPMFDPDTCTGVVSTPARCTIKN